MSETAQPRFSDVIKETYERFEDDGSVLRVFQFIDGYEYDRIVIHTIDRKSVV
mgnify:CR=1 FL=1